MINEEMNEKFFENIYNLDLMKKTIRTRGNLSAPGKDYLTNPILRLEREGAARMMIELMKVIMQNGRCPQEWKGARTILLFKGGDKDDENNWRPITITSVLYRVIFCRISQALHHTFEKEDKLICDPEQKCFVPNRAGCVEHTAEANMIINDAVTNKKKLFMLSLDLRDAFGSVPHMLIKKNLKGIGIPLEVRKMIMDTYEGAYINIHTKGGETENIKIVKGVKQGCPLSPTLFNIGIDSLLRYLNKNYIEDGYPILFLIEMIRKWKFVE
jgi:hypothetical protein